MHSILETLHGNKKMGELGTGARWLNAHEDRSAGVRTFSGRCVALCDASGTGDHCLVIAEPKFTLPTNSDNVTEDKNNSANATKKLVTGRLRVYRGAATLYSDRPLHGAPSGLVAFYTDELEPRVPAVAVSVGGEVLLYKNSKPFFKFTIPPLPITALEQDIWIRFAEENYDPSTLSAQIESLKSIPFKELSSRSQRLLTLVNSKTDNNQVLEEYIGRYIHAEIPSKLSVITCIGFLNKNSMNENAVACLVVATEAGHVYFFDPQGFSILHQASVCSDTESASPALMTCTGMFDVEFRCLVCLRDGNVCILRRGWLEGRKILQAPTGTVVVEMVIIQPEQFIVLGMTDGNILCYTKRGKKLWSVSTGTSTAVTCLSLVPLPHLNTCLVAAGVRHLNENGSGILQLYQGRNLVDTIHLPDSPASVKFGRLGQEENILVIITSDGSLLFKILKRTADFNASISQQDVNNSAAQLSRPLPLPKRSKLFAEQTQRERQNAQMIHQTFQQDLIELRLAAARATVQALGTADNNISNNNKHPVKLAAQVLGLGPKFTLTLTIENLSNEKAVTDLNVVLHTQNTKYKIGKPFIMIPLIPPELQYKIETSVTEILDGNENKNIENEELIIIPIRVFVVIPGKIQPVLAATINMPPTDPLAFML